VLSLFGSTFSSEERIECSSPFWRLLFFLIFLPSPPWNCFPGHQLTCSNCAHAFGKGRILPPSLVACVFARWHQELGHDSSELVCLVVDRVVVCAKGHGGLTSFTVADVSAGVVCGQLAGPVKETAGDGDLFCALAYPLMAWDPARCLLRGCIWLLLLLALRIKVRVDRWFQVSAVLNWIPENHASSWSSIVWIGRC
jgi:hypothetical protein